MTSPLYYEQAIYILDTTTSINSTSGALISYGGVSIADTTISTNTSSGALLVSGGLGLQGALYGFNAVFTSTTESVGTGSGSVVVNGGLGIAKNINIGGDAIIAGNLYVNGVTTSVNTTTLNVSDNTLLLNSGPSGSRDSGVLIQRFQLANDTGAGDVVSAGEPIAYSDTAVSGTTTTIEFSAGASAIDDFYLNWWIKITLSGTVNVRQITAYDGTTKVATVATPFTQAPGTEPFDLYNRNFVAQYYDEVLDVITMGYTATETDIQIAINPSSYANVRVGAIYAASGTIGNFVANTISAGSLSFNSASVTDLVVTNGATINNAIVTTSTIATLLVSSDATVGSLSVVNGTTLSNLAVTGAATLGSLLVTGGSILTNATIGNLNASFSTLGSVFVSDATISNLRTNDTVMTNTTISNLVSAFSTLGSVFVSDATVSNLRANDTVMTNTTISNLVSAFSTLGSIFVSDATVSNLTVTQDTVLNGTTISSLRVTGASTLGSLVVTGGTLLTDVTASNLVVNTVDVTPSLGDIVKERSFAAANNVAAAANITGFAFDAAIVRSFDAICSVSIVAGTNRYTLFTIKGVNQNGSWVINTSFVGSNNSGITFSITSLGQIQYRSTNLAGFVSDTMKFKAETTSV